MLRSLLSLSVACLTAAVSAAQPPAFPATFRVREIATNGATIHVRVGGRGPAVVLLHGFGDTGDMWAPLAADLARDHTVVVPDLRGFGLSSHPAAGYDKMTQAADVAGVLDALDVRQADVVGHDIGNMVAFAFAARYPGRITRLVLMDAPIPGVANWDELSHDPRVWHFRFQGPDAERLVAGRERIYLDRFWNEFAADPAKLTEGIRAHYAALYARPGAIHAAFNQFAAFDQDARDNRAALASLPDGKLATPVLAIGADHSYGAKMADIARAAFAEVEGAVVQDSGHWLMEEQPGAVIAAVRPFLAGQRAPTAATRP
jgi:pimeloyl-ACP methyl ester carboxylesterase